MKNDAPPTCMEIDLARKLREDLITTIRRNGDMMRVVLDNPAIVSILRAVLASLLLDITEAKKEFNK